MTVQLPLPDLPPCNMTERATEVRMIVRNTEQLKVRIMSEHIAALFKR